MEYNIDFSNKEKELDSQYIIQYYLYLDLLDT